MTYSLKKHDYHLRQLYTNPKLKDFLIENHNKIWARSKFNELCKVDYVNNNLAECFNSWIRHTKGLHLVDMLDKIRTMIMAKFSLRQKISAEKFVGHMVIPAVLKKLYDGSKAPGLRMTLVGRNAFEAEVTAVDKNKMEWRYPVNLQRRTCSCRQWQFTGLPCIHAMYFITHSLNAEFDSYVHSYYLVSTFNAAYVDNVPSIEGKHQWTIVDPGFVLHPPVQGRAPGRPRKVRIRSNAEGKGLGPRKRKCKRCG